MFSIKPYSVSNSYSLRNNTLNKSVQSFAGYDVSDLLSKGDDALNNNKFDEALKYYQEANQKNPDELQTYRKLGKTYFNLKDYATAEKNFETYLASKPEDIDTWVELGESQRQHGLYQKALASFQKAQSLDSANDLANRSILETKNNILSIYNPERAKSEKQAYAAQNLRTALNMTVNYMTPEYMKELEDVSIQFGETATMGGTSNIAQYENYKKAITVSNSYIYASPQVIAAYLTHESVHAHDKDPYTSVREEQDAYQIATKFWIQHSNGVSDPEMDYAAELYTKSPTTLSKRVAEIYKLRDPDIAETSPNHPPKKLFHLNPTKRKAASQAIKTYDVIA
ncbi:MAG: tetratricopeptide repeat protein [Candidatus Gastranaerophilales bacterium]|nr:tetratricopeptide repeat protein [Candidatus Gastranaerophilales bacterium]